jgi:pimeloyl-ACP methyl ester carboxylesterase
VRELCDGETLRSTTRRAPLQQTFEVIFVAPVIAVVLVLMVVGGLIYQSVGLIRDARMWPPPGRMIDADGHRLHVVCVGSGHPTVVFESAIAASSLSWTSVLPKVATFTRGCVYDRAGLGWSEPARGVRTLARMIDDLRAVLNSGGVGPYVLVGHSFGAFLVCVYASLHPEDVAGLLLLDPPSEWLEMTRQKAHLLQGGIQLSRVGAILARFGIVRACLACLSGGAPEVPRNIVKIFGPTAARTLTRLVGEVRKLPADVHPIVQALWCQPKCFHAMARHLAALEETAAVVAGITVLPDVPLMIISDGDQSPATIARHRVLAGLSPQSRHIVATTGGHWIQFDEPDIVVAAIREIVDHARRTHAA